MRIDKTVKQNETETKLSESEAKRNETKQDETKQNMKHYEAKRK